MSDRACIRGCVQRDVHYATCAGDCKGCAPRECRDGSLICDRCFGRLRGLMDDTPDLLGRLRSLADPAKATPTDQVRVASTQIEAPAPVADDLLDAIGAVDVALSWADPDLQWASNNRDEILHLAALFLDRHPPVDGVRTAWSVQDAVDRWGVERRDHTPAPEPDDERLEVTTPVIEWGDPLLNRAEAEQVAGSASTLRRWEKQGHIQPAGVIWVAGRRTALYRQSVLLTCRDRFRGDNHD